MIIILPPPLRAGHCLLAPAQSTVRYGTVHKVPVVERCELQYFEKMVEEVMALIL